MEKSYKTLSKEILFPMIAILQESPWKNPIQLIKKIISHFHNDLLYRNSIYLILSTTVMSIFGFLYWIITARIYTVEQIGLATTMISVMNLIGSFSILGLNNGLIRYLPTIDKKNELINTVLTIVGLASLMIVIFYILFIDVFSPKLLLIKDNLLFLILFIIVVTLSSINVLTDSIFIAFRSTKYILIYDTFYSISKIVIAFFLIALGAYGIFLSFSVGVLIALLLTFYYMFKKFEYKFYININKKVVAKIAKFSIANYTATFLGGLPTLILPLIILNKLGSKESAYFYMSIMIANIVFIIPSSISSSLFSESSHNENNIKYLVKKTFNLTLLFAYPAILVVIFFGKYILLFFGKEYSREGVLFLQLVSASCFLSSINSIFSIILRLKNRIYILNFIALLSSILLIGLSYIMLRLRLTGIGYAWLFSQVIITLVYIYFLKENILKAIRITH